MVTDLDRERERRAEHRFRETLRQAVAHATPGDRLRVLGLVEAVNTGLMVREDAHEALKSLQRAQQAA